ncbi:MAG: dihydroxyacetone kinase subunit L [Bacteroidales bacterium]|nr:dihydroxyacetone kinase subunit L [Bacteroidales bacterium]
MASFTKEEGIIVLYNIISVIQENKQYLSDIDGAIGDGDHGINMNKGFSMCREELDENPGDLPYGLNVLSRVLMMKIGGSMGPLYGKFFKGISTSLAEKDRIDAQAFGEALSASKESISAISQARVGDKTLVDAFYPAVDAYHKALNEGKNFTEALADMKQAANAGRDNTQDMVAKIGRSSRLGERSKGVIDAGAASCALILETMADTITGLIDK